MIGRIGEGELLVMEELWAAGRPLTALEVFDRLGPVRGWEPSTIKSMLARLLAKRVIIHEQKGRRYLYQPAVDREKYAARESRRFVDRLFGGRAAPLVAHLAEGDNLTRADIEELRALLRTLRP